MKRIISHPVTNAVCISIFSLFYGIVFIATAKGAAQVVAACGLLGLTVLVDSLLLRRRRSYDEYHTTILVTCLVIALVLMMITVAVFFLMILSQPTGVVEKFSLFAAIHWGTVVLADLAYVLICRWR